ncbi:tail fiber assembly protein [Rahnella selenatireducens]|uniref:tail fiber assembly protein n=1 Tax=Rahnella selenatireducens TaxID=3389797 RepID=UPI003969771A
MKISKYGPFTLRNNLTDEEKILATTHAVNFIGDSFGNDWYQLQKKFLENSIKIVYEEPNGLIISASYDVSALWPQSFNIAELDSVPDDFTLPVTGGCWTFDGEKIVNRIYSKAESKEIADEKKKQLLNQATNIIMPLQDAKELLMADEDELSTLSNWIIYRILVSRIDTSTAPDITWPEIPA